MKRLTPTPPEIVTAQVPLRPGERVRVTYRRSCPPTLAGCLDGRSRRYVGTFVTWNADTLVVKSKGDTVAVPRDSVTTLEVSAKRGYSKANATKGLIIGLVAGGAIGALVGAATAPRAGCVGFYSKSQANCTKNGAALGLLGGAAVGGVIGALIPADTWQEVSLGRVGVSLEAQPKGGVDVGASVRF